jgi:hypothetical protein
MIEPAMTARITAAPDTNRPKIRVIQILQATGESKRKHNQFQISTARNWS